MKEISQRFGLNYNKEDYGRTFIEAPRRLFNFTNLPLPLTPDLVAYVESEAKAGELDGLTNEWSSMGYNMRLYDGLKIHLLNGDYISQISNLADITSGILNVDVEVITDIPNLSRLKLERHIPENLQSRLKKLYKLEKSKNHSQSNNVNNLFGKNNWTSYL